MIKQIAINIVLIAMKLLWILPIDKTRITFISFNGTQYSDSPKYIYEELIKKYTLKYSWILPSNNNYSIPGDYEIINKGSLMEIIRLLTSKCIVTNNYLPTYIPIRKNQIVLNTWHGGGSFKRVGLMSCTVSEYDKWFFEVHKKKYSAFNCDSCVTEDLLLRKSFGFQGEVLRFGLPRNAVLLKPNNDIRNKVRDTLGVDGIVVLYAPTFRGTASKGGFINDALALDTASVLSAVIKKYHKNGTILFRGHHTFKKSFSLNCINVSEYPDMQELLIASDILITDYSSCMWDMAIAQKPVFIYAPDIEEYCINPGFYQDITELPFYVSKTNEELVEAILQFNGIHYLEDLKKYFAKMGSYEKSDSAFKTCQWLLNQIGN